MSELYQEFIHRLEKSNDENRTKSTGKRHKKGFRTARENLNDLVDDNSFLEIWTICCRSPKKQARLR